jgi:hypothetical protein
VTTAIARKPFGIERHALWLALLTVAFSIGWFLLDGHLKINFADEGYLWYGAEAIRRGEVPMRDFEAYDPGRYLWVAGWSFLLGQSLVSLRLACVFFQCLGVFCGLLVARRLSRNWLFLACVALLFCAWMHPRFKLFEQSVALMAVYAGVVLLERPSLRRHFLVGIFGGLSAFIGRNHGAYHVFAIGLLIAWSAWPEGWRAWLRRTFVWGCGLLVGYLPQLLMFLFVPGFFNAFMLYITGMLKTGATNLATSVPWPWLDRSAYPLWFRFTGTVEGCWYVGLLLFFVLALLRLVTLRRERRRDHPALIASVLVSLPYAHFVFSRPDIVHLSHGAPTAALGMLALASTFSGPRKRIEYALAPLLLAASVLANLFQFGVSLRLFSSPAQLFEIDVRGDRMIVPRRHAQVLESARHVAEDLAKPNEPILFMPHFPTLYSVTQRRSPTWQIYFVSPPDDVKLLDEIKKAGVQWVFFQDYALDGRQDLRFRNTNPRVIKYFAEEFTRVPIDTLPADMIVLHRRSAAQP